MYDTLQDAHMRLGSTVIRYNDKPIFVNDVCMVDDKVGIKFTYILEENREYKYIPVDDPLLDVSSAPLGYTQYTLDIAVFCMRMPSRKQLQGLAPNRIVVVSEEYPNGMRYPLNKTHVAKAIVADVPGFDAYDKWVKSNKRGWSISLSRNFAASYTTLFYRGHPIGFITHKEDIHTIKMKSESFKFFTHKELNHANWRIVG